MKVEVTQQIKDTIVSFNATQILRKDLLTATQALGIADKEVYFVLHTLNRCSSGKRGYYSAAKMLDTIDRRLGISFTTPSTPAPKKPKKSRIVTKSLAESPSSNTGCFNHGPLSYTDADMAEELELMGTYL